MLTKALKRRTGHSYISWRYDAQKGCRNIAHSRNHDTSKNCVDEEWGKLVESREAELVKTQVGIIPIYQVGIAWKRIKICSDRKDFFKTPSAGDGFQSSKEVFCQKQRKPIEQTKGVIHT